MCNLRFLSSFEAVPKYPFSYRENVCMPNFRTFQAFKGLLGLYLDRQQTKKYFGANLYRLKTFIFRVVDFSDSKM